MTEEYRKYMHVERFGNGAVSGINEGIVHIFPKLDGTNGSVYRNTQGVQAGSRNRILSEDEDNAGFFKEHVKGNANLEQYLEEFPDHILYGEWLVPHTLKTYIDDAWRKFYVFDVFDRFEEKYLPYDDYIQGLVKHDIRHIQPVAVLKNPPYEQLLEVAKNTNWLCAEGAGEGVVIKNYDYINQWGRTVFAKIINQTFDQKQPKNIKNRQEMSEVAFCETCLTKEIAEKVKANIINAEGSWEDKHIPRLLHTVYHDLVTEELWDFLKTSKTKIIDFKTLQSVAFNKTKQLLPELF